MGECKRGNRIRNITKQKTMVVKVFRYSSEKNGIAKSRSLRCKRKKNTEILHGSFQKGHAEKNKT